MHTRVTCLLEVSLIVELQVIQWHGDAVGVIGILAKCLCSRSSQISVGFTIGALPDHSDLP